MKQIISILLFLYALGINAQDTDKKSPPPEIITKLKIGTSISLDTKSLRFINLIEDSRCPSGVSCVWAGQAKVLIGIYENDILLEEKEIIIGAKGITPHNPKELLASGAKKVFGYNLTPYPSYNSTITASEYYLEVVVK